MAITFDFEDGNGPVPARRHRNPDGSVGGWVADTATVEPTAYVGADAKVYGNATVLDDAVLSGRATVSGNATVSGRARVAGDAQVSSSAWVSGRAVVYGNARVGGDTIVWSDDKVFGDVAGWKRKGKRMHEEGAMVERAEAEIPKEVGDELASLLREALCMTGRMAIGYAVADQVCRHALGQGIDALMPAGGWGTCVALFVTDVGLMKAVDAVAERITGNADPKLVKNQAKAEFINGGVNGGVWIVSGIEAHGMETVTVMDPKEFHRFEARIAKRGASLTKVVPGADGAVTTMSYVSGKLHRVGAPAVVRAKDGVTVEEVWFEGGRQVDAPSPSIGMSI